MSIKSLLVVSSVVASSDQLPILIARAALTYQLLGLGAMIKPKRLLATNIVRSVYDTAWGLIYTLV